VGTRSDGVQVVSRSRHRHEDFFRSSALLYPWAHVGPIPSMALSSDPFRVRGRIDALGSEQRTAETSRAVLDSWRDLERNRISSWINDSLEKQEELELPRTPHLGSLYLGSP